MTVRSVRAPLALLLDLAWTFAAVAVFVQIFGQGDGPAPSLAIAALVVGGSFLLARLLQLTELDEGAIRIVGVALSAGVLFIAFRIEYAPDEWPIATGWLWSLLSDGEDSIGPNGHVIAGIVALVPFWLRGVIRGQDSDTDLDDVLTSASLGLVPVLIAALTQPDTREASSWGAYAFGYCMLALVTLAVFRVPQADTPLLVFLQRWAWAFAALAGVAFVLALVAVGLDSEEFGFLSPVGDALQPIGEAFGTYVLAPIFWVISLPFRALGWLLGMLWADPEPRQEQPQPPAGEPEEDESQPTWVRVAITTLAAFGTVGVVLVGLVVLWFAFRRFVRRRTTDDRERHDDIEPDSSLAADIGAMLGAFGRRFRRDREPESAVAIRRLYGEMLDDVAAHGIARPPSATPLQFLPAIEVQYASALPREITDAFVESRYGERAVDAARADDLRRRWRELRAGHAPEQF